MENGTSLLSISSNSTKKDITYISLMQDQVTNASSHGINAAYLKGQNGRAAITKSKGKIDLIYVIPELITKQDNFYKVLQLV